FAPDADLLLVAAAGPSLVALARGAAGVTVTRLATLGGDPVYEVVLDRAPGEPLGAAGAAGPALARALDRGAVATLAYMAGAAERALAMTVDHAGTRHQFGQPIGSFQAVAHRCVDMRTDLDALRHLVYQAAWSLEAGRRGTRRTRRPPGRGRFVRAPEPGRGGGALPRGAPSRRSPEPHRPDLWRARDPLHPAPGRERRRRGPGPLPRRRLPRARRAR